MVLMRLIITSTLWQTQQHTVTHPYAGVGAPTSDGSSVLFPRLLMLPLDVAHAVLLGVRLP